MELRIDFDKPEDKTRLWEILKTRKGIQDISIKKARKGRSQAQSKYYWGVVVAILCSEVGYFRDEMHELLKRMFLGYEKPDRNGVVREFSRSTTELSTVEMEDYLEKIRIWAQTELDIYIPLPGEFIEIE